MARHSFKKSKEVEKDINKDKLVAILLVLNTFICLVGLLKSYDII